MTQRLRILDGTFVIESPASEPAPGTFWIAQVRAPEGLTVIRESVPGNGAERWLAIYGDESAHALDVPGMLAAIVTPLADAAIPVFVTSTGRADLVFIPEQFKSVAVSALRAAGHTFAKCP
ncbi:MAG: ACT domain-containing protein [Trebonia sp.]